MQQLLVIFATIFLAELGDKTQLATLLFASGKQHHPVLIFAAAALALTASTAIAVALGASAQRWLIMLPLKPIAGAGFLLIGAWMLWEYFVLR